MQLKQSLRIYRDAKLAVLPTFTNYAAHYLRTTLPAASERAYKGMTTEQTVTAYTLAAMLAVVVVNLVVA